MIQFQNVLKTKFSFNRSIARFFTNELAEFENVGRKKGKEHYYQAFNQHLKELNRFKEKEDLPVRIKGRWKILKQQTLDEQQIIVRTEKDIKVSYLKLNLVTKLIRDLTVRAAVAQLTFSKKKHAKTALQLLSDACRDAKEKFDLSPDELQLDQVYIGRGSQLKRIRIMGRGRAGLGYKRFSHLTVQLKKIDFDEKIRNSKNVREAKEWVKQKLQVAAMSEKAKNL
mmetsp:Transcript_7909/g.11976  ORF Transcript_7909/g.11976 Transcript_7909/m.11976 type:complete len:226 (+) Transcript_7909:96-773(+)